MERRSLKKIRASTGFEPVTSAIPVRCSTNWAMKPHIGSEVNLLSSYLPVQWSVYVNRQDLQDNSLNQILCDFEFVDTDFSFLFIMNRQELSFKQRSLLFTVLLFRYSHLFVVNSIQSSFCRSINVWEHQFAIGQQLPCKIIRHIVSTCVVIIFIKCLEKCARRDWSERVHYISARARSRSARSTRLRLLFLCTSSCS